MKRDIIYTSFSETGIRQSNQDVCQVIEMPQQEKSLFIICDGMGGHSLGDMAAKIVCDTICRYWKENSEITDSPQKIYEACDAASEALTEYSERIFRVSMGTTMVMACIEKDKLLIAHCGDSRCYLLRNHEVAFQTKDHSSPQHNGAITKCFFSSAPQEYVPTIAEFKLQQDDRIFLCSDGVYNAIPPEIMSTHLQEHKPLEEIVCFIKSMCKEFSRDNYTGILIQIN